MISFLSNDNDSILLNLMNKDTVFARGGDDNVNEVGFRDTVFGGTGDDAFIVSYDVSGTMDAPQFGAPLIFGGLGDDTVFTYPDDPVEVREFRLFNVARIYFEESDVTMWAFGVENFDFTLV